MSELPDGWAATTLAEIVGLRGERTDPAKVPDLTFIGLDGIEPHTSAIINTRKASEVKSSVARFEAGDVLYSRLRPYLNKVTIPDFSGVASAEILALQANGGAEAEFIRRLIMTGEFLEFVAQLDKGDRPRVNYKDISKFPVSLPPIAEQRRIVAKVDGLTARIVRARKELDCIPILLTTHNPMAIAELVKEQVQILRLSKSEDGRQIIAVHPELDPKGLGYAAIVTSDMFGIASTLDQPTQLLLEQQRTYASIEKLTPEQQSQLDEINAKLDRLGFRFFHPDAEFSRYLRLRQEALRTQFDTHDPEQLIAGAMSLTRMEREEMGQRLIAELLEADKERGGEGN